MYILHIEHILYNVNVLDMYIYMYITLDIYTLDIYLRAYLLL